MLKDILLVDWSNVKELWKRMLIKLIVKTVVAFCSVSRTRIPNSLYITAHCSFFERSCLQRESE